MFSPSWLSRVGWPVNSRGEAGNFCLQMPSLAFRESGVPMDENQEQELFHALLGMCVLQWSHVEDGLCAIYISAIGLNHKRVASPYRLPATAAFYAALSADTKAAMANAAMTFHLQSLPESEGAPLLKQWDKLFGHVQSRQQARNKIAHFQSLVETQSPPGRQRTLRPRLFDPNNLTRYRGKRMPIYRVHDLEQIRRSFGILTRKLQCFSAQFEKEPPEAFS
jgi:hypothetical protein